MNPIFAQYSSLSTALQALHESNINLIESLLLSRVRNLLQRFLEKIDTLRDAIFSDAKLQGENELLKQEIEKLQSELKGKNRLLDLLEEEYLKTKDKTKTFQVAIHEMKTPLTSIIGFSEILLKEHNFDESQEKILQRIHNAGHKQLEIIDKMLSDVIQTPVKLEEANVQNLIDELQANIQVLAEKKGLEFQITLENALPQSIQTDLFKLESILTNLLSNAVKYTDQGRIVLKVSMSQDRRIVFEVKDTGRGIEADELEAIFSFYERGSNIEGQEGHGIGLALCREMSELLDGSLSVASEGIGKGSTFVLDVPTEPEVILY